MSLGIAMKTIQQEPLDTPVLWRDIGIMKAVLEKGAAHTAVNEKPLLDRQQ